MRARSDRDGLLQRPNIDVSFGEDDLRHHAVVLVYSAQVVKTISRHSNTNVVLMQGATAGARSIGVP